jgi:hypothetical protein
MSTPSGNFIISRLAGQIWRQRRHAADCGARRVSGISVLLIYFTALSERYRVIFTTWLHLAMKLRRESRRSALSPRCLRCDFHPLSLAGIALYSLRIALNTQGFLDRQLLRR